MELRREEFNTDRMKTQKGHFFDDESRDSYLHWTVTVSKAMMPDLQMTIDWKAVCDSVDVGAKLF